MDCTLSQRELVPFHFGTVEPAVREELEGHLLTCASCLRDYLALKRDIETAAAVEAPSAAARGRLRSAVAQQLNRPVVVRAWWERPLAAAFAGVTLVGALVASRLVTSAPGAPPHGVSAPGPADPP